MSTSPDFPLFGSRRNALIVGSVLAFHVAALWALNTGLVRRVAEVFVPAEVIAEMLSPAPQPRPAPPPPAPKPAPRTPAPAPAVDKPQPQPVPQPAPLPVAAAPSASPAPNAPVVPAAPAAPAVATGPATPAPPAPARIDLPSSDADYLQNPKPAYPPVSKRLGEQGKVIVRVLIAADGTPQKAELRQSSGFERLDQAALATVLKWRYVPGKRGGVAEAMWFNVPINFVLE
ncbi:energy transducer TonB [Ramlibacter sp. MAHUQ-53]|uniref:energy transducer TonB n=1 Tax=unclassified Ramlibacter TaxID=2617605 RepID=UPI00363E52A8